MGNVSSHTYTYAGKRSFACNCEENNGKCGLAPPNNRFERTHGTSPFAAQPNVMLDEAVIMPNHFHGIVFLQDIEGVAQLDSPEPKRHTLSEIIRNLKTY